jgi:cytochrome c oxidase subunit 2
MKKSVMPSLLLVMPAIALGLGGCGGVQSALAPQGPEAAREALMSWILFAGSGVILMGVMLLAGIALGGGAAWRGRLASEKLVIGGGLVFPIVVLTALLGYGLFALRAGALSPAAEADAVRIAVVGERWWWRVIYKDGDKRIESANELRIPTKRPVVIELTSADVIHSFWVPRLAGKLDMIPGRTNVLRLSASEPGMSRGQCAEYCGGAHALMSFYVVAMPEADFALWLKNESAPARSVEDPLAQQGGMLFISHGCAACHTIRGTAAAGKIGPDLTHVGGRLSLAAATLANDEAALARWITDNQHIKPENLMPPFGIFSASELAALSRYLAQLK